MLDSTLNVQSIIQQKNDHRSAMRFKRLLISPKRRYAASQNVLEGLSSLLIQYSHVLSFASFGPELDTWPLNSILAQMEMLILPVVVKTELRLFKVSDMQKQLKKSSLGILEPDPTLCVEIDLRLVDAILVPGLAFDRMNHRLGYGKGYYDRLLKGCPRETSTIGIGFVEQQYDGNLPVLPTDVALKQVYHF